MGTRRSRHNRGRKPLYKEHRLNLVSEIFSSPATPISVRETEQPQLPSIDHSSAPLSDPFPGFLTEDHRAAIEFLKAYDIAAIPGGICHGASLVKLERHGIIQKTGIPGYWSITEEGMLIDLSAEENRPAPKTQLTPAEPAGSEAKKLREAYASIDRLLPGSMMFDQPVRQSALEAVAGRSRAQKFVYFAYPIGFPLKHIAWAAAPDKPLWTDHNICVVRGQVLRLPAMRKRVRPPIMMAPEEISLRAQLIDEGLSPWEVDEYFALSPVRVAL